VPGVDAIYLGPFDLCLSLGLNPMHQPFAEIDAVVNRMVEVARTASIAAGIGATTPGELRDRQTQGFTLLGYGPDYYLLANAARAALAAFRGNAH
jgi:4-hydroxy-2-oxoheptanedioate aldolase